MKCVIDKIWCGKREHDMKTLQEWVKKCIEISYGIYRKLSSLHVWWHS